VKLDDLSDDAAVAKKRMRSAGLHLFKEAMAKAIDQARSVSSFPRLPLIDRPGWSGPHFALPSGDVYSPEGVAEAIVLFEPDPHKCARAGNKAWLDGVGRLAAGQPLLTFALMIAFTGPILRALEKAPSSTWLRRWLDRPWDPTGATIGSLPIRP
jgi:hypothetical protein